MSVNEQTSRQVDKLLPILINVIIKILSCKSKQLVYSSERKTCETKKSNE